MARRGDDEDHCEVDFYLHTYEFRPNFAFHMREAVDKQRNRRRKIQRRLREIEQARKAHEQKENGTSSSDTSGEEQAPPPDATAVQETVEMIAKREELRKREWVRHFIYLSFVIHLPLSVSLTFPACFDFCLTQLMGLLSRNDFKRWRRPFSMSSRKWANHTFWVRHAETRCSLIFPVFISEFRESPSPLRLRFLLALFFHRICSRVL